MNRLILKYSYPVTAVILLVFAWVVYRRLAGGVGAIIPLAVAAAFVWVFGSLVFIYFWPWITVGGFKRAILKRGFGGGPIPLNTLYAVLDRPSQSASTSSVMGTGADDLLYIGGWLDVNAGPRALRVPEMDGRYYSVQLTDPISGANFAYVGKTDHRQLCRRLPTLRAGLEGRSASWHDPNRRAASFGPPHRSGVCRR